MTPTIKEYIALLIIGTSNPNKVFWKKTKGVGFVKKIYQIIGIDATIIGVTPDLKVDMWQPSPVLEWISVSQILAKNPQSILISKPV